MLSDQSNSQACFHFKSIPQLLKLWIIYLFYDLSSTIFVSDSASCMFVAGCRLFLYICLHTSLPSSIRKGEDLHGTLFADWKPNGCCHVLQSLVSTICYLNTKCVERLISNIYELKVAANSLEKLPLTKLFGNKNCKPKTEWEFKCVLYSSPLRLNVRFQGIIWRGFPFFPFSLLYFSKKKGPIFLK